MSRRYTRITSLLLDEASEKTLKTLSSQQGVDKSELIRRMISWQQFLLDARKLQRRLSLKLEKHQLSDEDDFERFIK